MEIQFSNSYLLNEINLRTINQIHFLKIELNTNLICLSYKRYLSEISEMNEKFK